MKLIHFLVQFTSFSRRQISARILSGEVMVDGAIARQLNQLVRKDQTVVLSGDVVRSNFKLYTYKFYKPKGVLSTMEDPKGRLCLQSFMTDMRDIVFPVGRLDRATSGLLLFTNDGMLAQHISHPRFSVFKRYRVRLDQPLTKHDFQRLLAGIVLEDGPVVYSDILQESPLQFVLSLSEGRNRIIRRTFQQMGYEVVFLKRFAIGPVQLGTLKEGKSVLLSPKEMTSLKKDCQYGSGEWI